MFAFLGIVKIILMVLVIGGLTGAIYLFSQSKKESHKRFRSLGLIVVLVVVLAILLLGLIRFGNVFAAIWIFNVLTDKISSTTGWDIWLTRAIAIPITALITWLLSFIFSFQKKRRQLGYGLLAILAVMMCLGMFGLTNNTYFNYQTGASERWYAATPEGYRLFDSPGFDPKYKIQLQPVTPEIQRKIDSWRANPGQVKVSSGKEEVFFDMITGEPCQWYYQAEDGSYEFFSKPGAHPKYGVELKPVTKDVVRDWGTKKAKAEDEKLKLENKLKDAETKSKQLESEKVKIEVERKDLEKEQIEVKENQENEKREVEKLKKEKTETEKQAKQLQIQLERNQKDIKDKLDEEKQETASIQQESQEITETEKTTGEIKKAKIVIEDLTCEAKKGYGRFLNLKISETQGVDVVLYSYRFIAVLNPPRLIKKRVDISGKWRINLILKGNTTMNLYMVNEFIDKKLFQKYFPKRPGESIEIYFYVWGTEGQTSSEFKKKFTYESLEQFLTLAEQIEAD